MTNIVLFIKNKDFFYRGNTIKKTYKIIIILLITILLGCTDQTTKKYIFSKNIISPKNLEAVTFSPTQIVLVWSDYSNNETAFIIERSEDKNNFMLLKKMPNNSVTYLDKNCSSNKKYYYRVKAVRNSLQSQYSKIAVAQTTDK